MSEIEMTPKIEKRWISEDIFHQMPVCICVLDRDLRVINANEKFAATFGEWKECFCYEVYKGRTEPCEDCEAEKVFESGEVRIKRQYGIDRDGNRIHYVVHLAPLVEEDGSIRHVIEMSTDVTELKTVQNQLKAEQERYRLLFDEVPCFISIQDREFNLLETNRLFKDYFGESGGRRCYEVYKHRTEKCYPCPVAETFADGEVHRYEEHVTSKDGEKINVICYTAPLRNEAGEITAVMEMATDITRIRQLQSQLTSIGLLVGSISHGIKGLLMGLDGGIYAVDTGFERDDRARVDLGWKMVKRNVNKIRSLVLDILYYAKDREPDLEEIDSLEMGTELALMVNERARDLKVKFETKFSPYSGFFEADLKAVRTMLINLLENAFEACRVDSSKDRQSQSVLLAINGDDDNIYFKVTDNGIGMDAETLNKLFTLFFSSKGSGGTGLGLFISNKIVLKHGGSITVDSTLGEGSTFTVRLPRKNSISTEEISPEETLQ